MKKNESRGFDYYLSQDVIERYREKPPELRLKWLYMGNLLRKEYSKRVIEFQDKLREGKI